MKPTKTLVVLVSMLVLMIPLSFAALTDKATLINHFDSACNYNNATDGVDGVINSAPTLDTNRQVGTQSCFFDGGSDWVDYVNGEIIAGTNTINKTVSFWVNKTTASETNYILASDITIKDGTWAYSMFSGSGSEFWGLEMRHDGSGKNLNSVGSNAEVYQTNSWEMMTIVFNYTDTTGYAYFYVNETLVDEVTTSITSFTTISDGVRIGDLQRASGSRLNSGIDELVFWNRSLSSDEIEEHYTSGVAGTNIGQSAPVDAPTVTIVYPEEDRLYAVSQLDINYTATTDAAHNVSGYNIYINGTLNQTVVGDGNTSIDIGDGLYILTIELTDTNGASVNDTINSFKIDTVNPFDDLSFVIPNGTIFFTDANIDVTATNTNLFGHNVTVYDESNNQVFSSQTVNISAPTHIITIPIDVVSFGTGTYRVVSNESDDHTKNRIKNYDVQLRNTDKRVRYNTGNALVDIQLVEATKNGKSIKNKLRSVKSTKQADRYQFGFEMNDNGMIDYEFDIVSDHKIYYRQDSGYSGHFVLSDHWVDFEPYAATVSQVSDTHYKVFVRAPADVTFESIGGVNFGDSETFFEIKEPEASNVQCDFGSGATTCAATEGDTLEAVSANCVQSLNSTVSIFNVTGNASVIQDFLGTNVSSAYNYGHPDFALTDDELNVTVFCISDLSTDSFSVVFTPSTAAAPVDADTEVTNGVVQAAAAAFLAVFFVAIFFTVYGDVRGKRRKKQ